MNMTMVHKEQSLIIDARRMSTVDRRRRAMSGLGCVVDRQVVFHAVPLFELPATERNSLQSAQRNVCVPAPCWYPTHLVASQANMHQHVVDQHLVCMAADRAVSLLLPARSMDPWIHLDR